MKIDFDDFYHEWPMKNPVSVEKYYLNDGHILDTRQMTYAFIDLGQVGMEPTFEIDDVILHQRDSEPYVIVKIERFASEVYAEKLDANMKRTNDFIWLEETEIYHKLKDVEWIYKSSK